jgi:hypothetical protein
MPRLLLAALAVMSLLPLSAPLMAQGAPPQGGAGQPYTIEYYYKVQWGHQQEFLDLFLRNHFPLLKKIASTGRIVALKIESPAYHATEVRDVARSVGLPEGIFLRDNRVRRIGGLSK